MPASIPSEIATEIQKAATDRLITLFEIDASALPNGAVLYFVPGDISGTPVQFNSITYTALPIEAEGFEWTGKGTLPTPTLRVSNIAGLFTSLLIGTNNMLGAVVTRRRTYREFLDDGATPDPTVQFPIDRYTIEQKVNHNGGQIEWKLSSVFDQQGVKLPRRQAFRNTCTHTYRRWDSGTSSFDYSNASCPYTGANGSFDIGGAPAADDSDVCGKKVVDCKLRFGQNGVLATRAFPGLTRFR